MAFRDTAKDFVDKLPKHRDNIFYNADGFVGPPDPAEASSWSGGGRLDAETLRRVGVGRVVEWLGTPGRLPDDHADLRLVIATPEFRVWQVP